jgi:DNA-binding transcriptional MerR regulator
METKKSYSVGGLARLAGVSVRTLHHYDRIGLLVPRRRQGSGYRVYEEKELLRLQEILLYRELELPLDLIGGILDRPGRDAREALAGHRRAIEEKVARCGVLLATIDRTIARSGGENTMLSDEQLYEGFRKEEIEEMKAEAAERWGDGEAYRISRKRLANMTKEQWATVKAEGDSVEKASAAAFLAGAFPGSPEALRLMERKAAWLRNFYEPSAELFRGLGEMYAADGRFRKTYDRYATGLADWLKEAMATYAARGMKA